MAANVKIPMSSESSFTESVTLDGNEYILSFKWNTRGAFWSMDIADANSSALVSGIRLAVSFPLNIQHPQLGMPIGIFIVYDSNPQTANIEPGRDDFTSGRKLQLLYWSKV